MKVTITPADQEIQEDIFKAGTLVFSEGWIVLVTNEPCLDTSEFSGMVVQSGDCTARYGEFDKGWVKDEFELFKGTITLEQ